MGWGNLAVAYPRSQTEGWIGSRLFAFQPLPGYAERFRILASTGKLFERSLFISVLQRSPYPSSRRYRRR